ncbi:hypothetical protein [Aquibaculum sediminis]|uniref:hypothetical protein n=1 Tax=Aquibaculum sediminis TaxID=3231907 RepID=UPI00345613AA
MPEIRDPNDRRRRPGSSDVHRAKRRKNLALLFALLTFIVLVFFVTIIRMGG